MKLFGFYLRLVRYRVAIMLLFFFLFGAAAHRPLRPFSLQYVLAFLALLSSYVAATSINDIVDKKVDEVNHPRNGDRLLVTGEATARDLYILHVAACFLALVSAGFIGALEVFIVSLSLLVNYLYSAPPIQLSYRTHFAPIILTIAYVFLPYWLGVAVSESRLTMSDSVMLTALGCLFFGRILLKDFRDRKGDKRFGKPTFLLVYGKKATCIVSSFAIALGNIILFVALPWKHLAVFGTLEIYFLFIYGFGYRLWIARTFRDEQGAIALGARTGNGLLLTVLGLFVLAFERAPIGAQLLFSGSLAMIYGFHAVMLITNPSSTVVSYKG